MLSVILTIYNYEQFVAEAINSVLAQDFSDFEIIAVDDGSQDSSWEKINMIRDSRLKCIQQKNNGQLSAFATGIKHSCGDIICFMDADDLYPPGYLRTVNQCFQKYPDCGFLFTSVKYFGQQEGICRLCDHTFRIGNHGFSAALIHLWIGAPTSACAVRTHFAKRIFPLKVCEAEWKTRADDILIWGADIVGCMKYFTPETFVLYRVHDNNNFFRQVQLTAIEKKNRSEAAVKACLCIRRKNDLSLSSLCKKEIQNRTYPWYITLLAYIKLLRNWQREEYFLAECLKCFLLMLKSIFAGKEICK